MPEAAPAFLPARRAGESGLVLPPFALGLWHSFGQNRDYETQRQLILAAYDAGIWHFDNANRYGPPHGWAEEVLGRVLREDLAAHRGAVVVATKAGNPIAAGPYGRGGSRKHLLEALDDSLRRLGLDHVDVFYHHSPDPEVPLDETVDALATAVRSGKTHYVAISNYDAARSRQAAKLLRQAGVPLVLHQHKYSLLHRAPEEALHDALRDERVGGIVYSPLAQGLLTDRYLAGSIPADARAASSPFLKADFLTEDYLRAARELQEIATAREQSLAQLALQWVLRDEVITTAILGVSSVAQLHANLATLQAEPLDEATIARVEAVAASASGV